MSPLTLKNLKIAIIGLGYVGLPLATYLARHFPVTGFDIDAKRIAALNEGEDHTGEVTAEEFTAVKHLTFSADVNDLADCNFYIITVPTPIDQSKRPDLTALISASRTVGQQLSNGNIVVYESTVYPGATEETCVPELEKTSNLVFNKDFYVGYSPERINPGDLSHRLPDIKKVTSGSTPETADLVDEVYGQVITAGTHKVSSIRAAEAAKVIENVQRDVNIALINELAMLFKEMGLDTSEVLKAAGTKWNFHSYQPGLVGGHCIGVDPYYLTHKAQTVGFHPEMILAGRRINDNMAKFVAQDVIKTMVKRGQRVGSARLLTMGFTFKENCPDFRNTQVANLVKELANFVDSVTIYDPLANPENAEEEYGLSIQNTLPAGPFDGVVLAVKHDQITAFGPQKLRELLSPNGLIYDIKNILHPGAADARL